MIWHVFLSIETEFIAKCAHSIISDQLTFACVNFFLCFFVFRVKKLEVEPLLEYVGSFYICIELFMSLLIMNGVTARWS